jgi:outer membrane protein OmpU
LAFNNTFGPVTLKADANASQLNFASERLLSGGTNIGFAGFTLGGALFNRSIPDHETAFSTTSPNSPYSGLTGITNSQLRALAFVGTSWTAGLAYATGPYAVSAGYFHDRTADSNHAADTTGEYALSAAYTFGPGMKFATTVFHYDFDVGTSNSAIKEATQNKGNGVYTGVQVNF